MVGTTIVELESIFGSIVIDSVLQEAYQGTTLEYVASAFNGWQAVKIGSQVVWVSGEHSEIITE